MNNSQRVKQHTIREKSPKYRQHEAQYKTISHDNLQEVSKHQHVNERSDNQRNEQIEHLNGQDLRDQANKAATEFTSYSTHVKTNPTTNIKRSYNKFSIL